MRKHAVRLAAIAVCLVWSALAAQAAGGGIPWAKTYEDAKAQAQQGKKLIMIDFYTDWCGWCKKLDADTYPDPKVVKAAADFVAVKVDAEKEGKELAAKYKVNGFPTILFIDPNADSAAQSDVAGSIVGYLPAAGFAEKLTQIEQSFKEFPVLDARYKANPKDVKTIGKLVGIYSARQDSKHAASLLEAGMKLDPTNANGYLTKAYNAVADQHQEAQEFDKAIPLFTKAAKTGKDPKDVSYAYSSIAMCYAQQRQFAKAIPYLKIVIAMPNAPKEDKTQAQQMLTQIKQVMGEASHSKK